MSQPIVPNKVKSETIIIPKGDTFDMRWLPKYDDGMRRVRTIPIYAKREIENVEPHVDDVREVSKVDVHTERPAVAPIEHNAPLIRTPEQNEKVQNDRGYGHLVPRRERKVKVAYLYKREQRTCIRHEMKTVYYGKHRWRCRR